MPSLKINCTLNKSRSNGQLEKAGNKPVSLIPRHHGRIEMKTINVEGLPEPAARALQAAADMLRAEMPQAKPADQPKTKVELPRWPGIVYGRLSREEI